MMLGGPVRTITEQVFRPFKTDKWDGMSIHKRTGKTEMGVQAHLTIPQKRLFWRTVASTPRP